MSATRKNLFVISLLLLVASCKGDARQQDVSFNLSRPLGQRNAYAMKYDFRHEEVYEDPDTNEVKSEVNEEVWNAQMETEVTDQGPDGSWTLVTRFTKVDVKSNGESDEETNKAWTGQTFTTRRDKDGRLSGALEAGEELNNDFRQRMVLMDPTMLMPSGPIKAGASWPIYVTHTIQKGEVPVVQTLRGTGTLKEVKDGRAVLDFVFTSEISMASPEASEEAAVWIADCTSTATYDLAKSRFTNNKIDMTIETPGDVLEDNPNLIKVIITSLMQFDLVGE
ncbi:MAG TPA: hypothetical protein VKA70_19425 [Blastocatellia bacterium]|nr:hypothetical protein [Blastocatellia bacterium]